MRLTDLLEARLLDVEGVELGRVRDVWLVQDGPPIGPFGAALRVERVVAGGAGIGSRLGYERASMTGPWPLAAFFHSRHAHGVSATWSEVAALEEGRILLRPAATALERPESIEEVQGRVAGRVFSAGLDLLDRQLVDPEGLMAGNVDDLELELREDGPPEVVSILAGPGALARRLAGHLGAWMASAHDLLKDPERRGPARISFGVVARIGSQVDLTIGREDLDTFESERWVRDHIIGKIPGA
jgi:sporulation protein YlmC with PRC-barrel domain